MYMQMAIYILFTLAALSILKIALLTHVYSEVAFSTIAKDFEEAGCTIYTMDEREESLEAIYLRRHH